MSDATIFAAIDEAFHDARRPSIGLSGGEAFVHFERLLKIVAYAAGRGAHVSINTNGFWGVTLPTSREKVRRIKQAGAAQLVVSTDGFHAPYIKRDRVLNVIRACKLEQLLVELQFVATRRSERLSDLLKEAGDALLNVACREIPCHPVGRAGEKVPEQDLLVEPGLPVGLCPSAVLSVSAAGSIIPCCNSAGHLPALSLGPVSGGLANAQDRFKNDPLHAALLLDGPASLVPSAIEAGFRPAAGYVDQCHLCHDILKDQDRAEAIRRATATSMEARFVASLVV